MTNIKQIEEEFDKEIWCADLKCPTCSVTRKLLRETLNQIIDEMIGDLETLLEEREEGYRAEMIEVMDEMIGERTKPEVGDDAFDVDIAYAGGYNDKREELKKHKEDFINIINNK